MVKILAITTALGILMLLSCQGTGVSREEFEEMKSEIKAIQDYLNELSVHYQKMTEAQIDLAKLQLKIPPQYRAVIMKSIEDDTNPEPRPPIPPGGPTRKASPK